MTEKQLVRLSKWVSLRLRHDPAGIGLMLDPAGWTAVDDLIAASARRGVHFDRGTLDTVVATNNKRRFEYDETGTRIRARQGHSVDVELGYADAVPPAVLFHGTASRFLPQIRSAGLLRMARHDVHLSADEITARAVGARHGAPIVLSVDAAAMTAAVPARYLTVPASD